MKRLLILLLFIAPALYGRQKDSKPVSRLSEAGTHSTATQKSLRPRDTLQTSTLVMGTVSQWQVRAEERFPELRSPDSAFSDAFRTAHEAMQEDNPGFLLANDWPMRLAESVAQSIKEGRANPLAVVR